MKAAVIERPKKFGVRELPYPKPEKSEVTIQVKACCVCGTDLHLIDGDWGSTVQYPIVPGHEFSGVIAEVGPGVYDYKVGERVGVEVFIRCGQCHFCKIGKENHCLNGHVIGHSGSKELKLDGAFAEYVVVPAQNVVPLSDGISFEEAAFIPNFATCVSALRRGRMRAGQSVLVFGTGANGLLLVQLAKVSGASTVVVTGRTRSRLDIGLQLGADAAVVADDKQEAALRKIAPYGYELVIEASGLPENVEKAFTFVKETGTIVLYGVCPADSRASISPFDIFKRDLEVIGSFSSIHCTETAQEMIAGGLIQVKPLISHHFSLDQFSDAIEAARDKARCMRAIVNPT